jgi:hypothetical protein
VLVEVHAALHRDVAKGAAGPELLLELVVQASGPAAGVGAPVADEDPVGAHVALTTSMPFARGREQRPSLSAGHD